MPDPETVRSAASVPTDRPARYGEQLATHLGRRSPATWDDGTGTGSVELGAGRATLTCGDGALDLEVSGGPDDVARLEDLVGRHLVRFGARDELVVRWTRSDGTPGTVQQHSAEGEPARLPGRREPRSDAVPRNAARVATSKTSSTSMVPGAGAVRGSWR